MGHAGGVKFINRLAARRHKSDGPAIGVGQAALPSTGVVTQNSG